MKFHVLTLFPEMVLQGLHTSILGRAAEKNYIEIEAVNIRDYSLDRHGKVDDYTYGGGAGMLMQAQPVYDAWEAVAMRGACRKPADDNGAGRPRTIYVTPQGVPFTQKLAAEFAREEELIFLCGHYEGIDDRALEEIVTDHVSIGDYVLTGGELAAMVMIDAIARLVPGVLHNEESARTESFHSDLLEYPQYSRPVEWRGRRVPEVLLSGNHEKIAAWRLERARERTMRIRPDLYEKYLEREALISRLSQRKRNNIHMMESLRRGRAEILFHEGDNVLLYDPAGRLYMAAGGASEEGVEKETSADKLISLISDDAKQIVVSREFLKKPVCARFPDMEVSECRLVCYTRKNPLPVRHKAIQKLEIGQLDYAAEHCAGETAEYLAERIRAGALWGSYADGRLVGFMGWRAEGDLDFWYVEPKYRGRGIGTSLEAFCINLQLEQGYTPYGYLRAQEEGLLRMQERTGLYPAWESVWRMKKK